MIDYEDILDVLCEYYSTTPFELFKETRKREYVYRRYFFMLFCRKYTKLSTFVIGDVAFDYGRNKPLDHATVLHGVRTMYNLLTYDKVLKRQYRDLNEMILENANDFELDSIIIVDVNLLALCSA